MFRIKRVFATALLLLVVGLGTPAAFAEGNAESPGVRSAQTSEDDSALYGSAESPGYLGGAESPDYIDMALIYLGVIL